MSKFDKAFITSLLTIILLIISFVSSDFILSTLPGWHTTVFPYYTIKIYISAWFIIIVMGLAVLKFKGFTDAKPLNYYLWFSFPFILLSLIFEFANYDSNTHLKWLFKLILPYSFSILLFILAHPVVFYKLYKNRSHKN